MPLLITAILLAVGHIGLSQHEENKAWSEIETRMEDTYENAFLPLHAAINPLNGIERFFAASEQVSRQEFTTFTEYALSQPEIIAAEWVPRVSRAERAVFESVSGAQIAESVIELRCRTGAAGIR